MKGTHTEITEQKVSIRKTNTYLISDLIDKVIEFESLTVYLLENDA
jgi:hypothetical protein